MMRPCDFWALTYAEFYEMAQGYRRRQIKKRNELIYHAWHVEALSRQQKLPELKSLMQNVERSADPPKQQTEEDMIAMCKLLNVAFGGNEVVV